MGASPIITLTTDFGLREAFVGIMKGVILGICGEARLVDLTHEVAPHDVVGAAPYNTSAIHAIRLEGTTLALAGEVGEFRDGTYPAVRAALWTATVT